MAIEKILVVDDEERILAIVKAYLEKDGYHVLGATNGAEALRYARLESPDLIVLDLMLPEVSGLEVCRTVRTFSNVPIIMLTAKDEDADKIVGLEVGADDYITKPFNPRELLARVHAVLRRTAAAPETMKTTFAGGLSIDTLRHEVFLGEKELALTPSEFALLEALSSHPGRVLSRLQLLEAVQGESFEGYERAIDSHIKNLRRKIEEDSRQPRYIITVFGLGYKFAGANVS